MTRVKDFSLRAILVMACMLLAPSMMWADKEIYVEYSRDASTLTFRYDENRASSTADTTYSLPASGEIPDWQWKHVEKAVFDESFQEARPVRCTYWFYDQYNLTEITGLENLNTDSVNDLSYMFYHCYRLPSVDLSGFNTSNVTSMYRMFYGCKSLTELDLTSFRTPKVDNMSEMFWACSNLKSVDLSTFNTQNVNNMYQMFFQDTALVKITTCDLFVTDQLSSSGSTEMFYNCRNLPGFSKDSVDKTKACYAPEGYFTQALPLSAWVEYDEATKTLTFHNDNARLVSTVANQYDLPTASNYPAWLKHNEDITKVVFGKGFADARPESCANWFYLMEYLTDITGLEYLNTSEVNDMSYMFYNCRALKTLDLSSFNTENVTTMKGMFNNCQALTTLDLSSFCTSKVDNMSEMFFACKSLGTLNLSTFDTRNVTTMAKMFWFCEKLTSLDLTSFDTEKVMDMSGMFKWCYLLKEIKVSGSFVTDQVTSSDEMFEECNNLPKHEESFCDISAAPYNLTYVTAVPWVEYANGTLTFHFDTNRKFCSNKTYNLPTAGKKPAWLERYSSNITKVVFDESFKDVRPKSCAKWFYQLSKLTEIDGFKYLNTDSVNDMSNMFENCTALTSLDLSSFNTENVTKMTSMFHYCSSLTELNLSSFRTSNVDDMMYMFSNCTSLTKLDLTSFDTRKVTDMSYLFACDSILSQVNVIDYFAVDQVKFSTLMFLKCTSLPNFDSNYTGHSKAKEYLTYAGPQMWAEYEAATKTLTFRYDNLRNYDGDTGIEKYDLPAANNDPEWMGHREDITKVVFVEAFADARPERCAKWFFEMRNLTEIEGLKYLNTSDVNDMSDMFSVCTSLTTLDLSTFQTSNVTTMARMFFGSTSLRELNVPSFCTERVNDMSDMFYDCESLTTLNLSSFCTESVTTMSYMFFKCKSLTDLNVSSFCTSKVTDMSNMFKDCEKLTELNLSKFDTENVTTMRGMFYGCQSLTELNLSSLRTSKVTDMGEMFYLCVKLTKLDLSSFNTENVTEMGHMFNSCSSLTSLNVSSFRTPKVTDMRYMFADCCDLPELDLSSFDTENVLTMYGMFSGCYSLKELDLTSFDTKNVKNMNQMFRNDNNLSRIYVSDLFVTDKVTDSEDMFYECSSLPHFTSDQLTKDKAHYKEGGYLTIRRQFTVGEKEYTAEGWGDETTCYEDVAFPDDEVYSSTFDFSFAENATASYTRTVKNRWSTLCLPFSFNADEGTTARFYSVSQYDNANLSVTPLTGTIAAGTPVLVYTDGSTISVTATGAAVVTAPANATDGTIQGVFTKTEVGDNDYIIANNHFWNAGWLKTKQSANGVYVAPYRAYLTLSFSDAAKPNSISIAEGETDGIERIDGAASLEDLLNGAELYDLQGRRLSAPQRGVMIIRKGSQTLKVLGAQTL